MKWPRRGALVERRLRWGLTWRGWLALLAIVAAAATYGFRHMLDFLAVRDPVPAHVLVIESWLGDIDLDAAVAICRGGHYDRVYLTGGPLEYSDPMHKYQTYPELLDLDLIDRGIPAHLLVPVPAPREKRDRTYSSALALRRWFLAHGGPPPALDIVTTAQHSRRTRLLFEHALGDRVRIGMIPIWSPDFDHHRWWRSSQGAKEVLVEMIGYLYARVQVAWLTAS